MKKTIFISRERICMRDIGDLEIKGAFLRFLKFDIPPTLK
jgi:hypothetical protein